MRDNHGLPTVHNYPGLELAGLDDGWGNYGGRGMSGLGESALDQLMSLAKAKFESELAPLVRAEAAKGAKAAVQPLVMASIALSGIAGVLALAALFKKR